MPQASLPHVLLEHRPSRLVLRLAFPSMAAMLASSLASLTDALFLSRVSSSLVSAAAYCLPLISLIQTVGFTLGMGAGSFVSRRLADRDTSRSESAASTALAAALALGALICLLGQLFPSSLLRLLGAQKNDLPAMIAYVRFLLAGAPITCASLVLGSLFAHRAVPCHAPPHIRWAPCLARCSVTFSSASCLWACSAPGSQCSRGKRSSSLFFLIICCAGTAPFDCPFAPFPCALQSPPTSCAPARRRWFVRA